MKITKKGKNLLVEIPLIAYRSNPYDNDGGSLGDEMPALVGCIDKKNYEQGFCHRIDMNYADKSDQLGNWILHYDGTPEDFEKLCKKLKIEVWYI